MHVFYPLPVTPNYVRLKKKKTQKHICEEKEKFDSTQTEECTIKKKHLETTTCDTSKRKTSIWQKINLSRKFSSFQLVQTSEIKVLVDQLKSQHSDWHKQEVSLFDLVESRSQNLELEEFFGLWMKQSYSGKELQSITMNIEVLHSFHDIINLYQQFSVINMYEEKKVLSIDEFRNKLFQALFYTKSQKYIPICNICSHIDKENLTTDIMAGDTKWLKLMSWWKSFNTLLVPYCLQLHKCLRNGINSDQKENQKVTRLHNDLYNILNNLNLINSPTKISMLKVYVDLHQKMPDIESWSISEEKALKEVGKNFSQNVLQDQSWTYFLKECSHYSLNLLFSIVKFMSENSQIQDITQTISDMVKNYTDNFFFRTIKQHLEMVTNEDYVNVVTETTMELLKTFLADIDIKKSEGNCDFETIVSINSQIIFLHMKLVVKKFQHLYYDSSTVITTKLISKYLIDTVTNGTILGNKALHNDLLSYNLLLKLNEEVLFLNGDFAMEASLKFAYIITACYKIINGNDAGMFSLPSDYIQHDFVAFLNDIQRELNIKPDVEISSTDFSLKIRILQDQLFEELGKSLSNITKVANNGKLLLYKAKYF